MSKTSTIQCQTYMNVYFNLFIYLLIYLYLFICLLIGVKKAEHYLVSSLHHNHALKISCGLFCVKPKDLENKLCANKCQDYTCVDVDKETVG